MIDVAEHELKTILDILTKHVNECEVRAFGSRVTWTNKDSSDLDLVVVCDKKLERGRIGKLREAFDESSLPFTVDVMDWHDITKEFQKNIEKSFYVLKKASKKTNNDWQYYKVSDFADVISGGTPKTEVSEYWNGNVPWITPKDLSNYNVREISRGERNISLEGLKNSSARLLPPRTVLLTSRAPVGYLAIAKNELTTNQGFKNLIVKNGFSPEFIYYLLLNNVDYLKLQASGSTFQELTASTLRNLEFLLPEYAVQKEIAIILGNIDDKIELLREQNKTLEAIAQAIYKRWFVDFEFPVTEPKNPDIIEDGQQPKADGAVFNTLHLKGYKSSGGKMVESELGEIPEGWKVGKIKDLIDILPGFAFSSSDFSKEGQYKLVTIKNVQDRYFNPQTKDKLKKLPKKMPDYCKLELGNILISLTGNVGRICLVHGKDYLLNQRVAKLRAKNENDHAFTYLLFLQDSILSLMQNTASGTAQQNLSPIQMKEIKIIIADRKILDKFGIVTNKLIKKIKNNISQIQTLSALRDSLLPKLMSGKLRVPTTTATEVCSNSFLRNGSRRSNVEESKGEE
jgi:type I restriction enzyme S subunit